MNKLYKIGLLSLVVSFSSCSDFLDETPDNRTLIDSSDKVRKLLSSAYTKSGFTIVTEFGTDNIVDEGDKNPYSDKIYEEIAYWKDITVQDNDDTKSAWEASYQAISSANLALQSIEELGGDLKDEKAEALMARAYAHFTLVNVFSKHYNPNTASDDLGIVYMSASETSLNPKYKRESVEEVYKKINADIEAALPGISDDIYEQPKYHFNKKAAYAFAARFNLFYGKWDKAKNYANKALNSSLLTNWGFYNTMVDDPDVRAKEYLKSDGIFLELTDISSAGLVYGLYKKCTRINHTEFISKRETIENFMPWGRLYKELSYSSDPYVKVTANYKKAIFPKFPYLFEFTDAVASQGYTRTVYSAFTADETLLVKAEAKIHLQDYDGALEDLNTFTANFFRGKITTIAEINKFYDEVPYSKTSPSALTQKKNLTPVGFSVVDTNQENMFHYMLQCRRLLTLHEGLRWFDIKRFGIEVNRFKSNDNGVYKLQDQLKVGDKRRAIQIPSDVISSGITANPR